MIAIERLPFIQPEITPLTPPSKITFGDGRVAGVFIPLSSVEKGLRQSHVCSFSSAVDALLSMHPDPKNHITLCSQMLERTEIPFPTSSPKPPPITPETPETPKEPKTPEIEINIPIPTTKKFVFKKRDRK